jgi:hypothetical protein
MKLSDFEIKETESGIEYIPWKNVEDILKEHNLTDKFDKWYIGQTAVAEGMFPIDMENFIALVDTGRELFFD